MGEFFCNPVIYNLRGKYFPYFKKARYTLIKKHTNFYGCNNYL